jgi:hypothetical protein
LSSIDLAFSRLRKPLGARFFVKGNEGLLTLMQIRSDDG